jgi:hypothetical protein
MTSLAGKGRRGSALARDPVEVRTAELEQQPAVRAWQELGAGPCPERLELLRRRHKSVVYRLPGVGRDGSDVIAKQCLWQIALDERAAYQLLHELPGSHLTYYGFVADPSRDVGWLFVEDARGEPWDPADPEQRRLAARWLAALHTASSRSTNAALLPDRGPAWFRSRLDFASRSIPPSFANPALPTEARPVLDGMLRLLDDVSTCWPEVETACAEMPHALVHGDFADRNVRIRCEGGEARVLAFDWEVAGWGLPAVDLPNVDLPAYAEAIERVWPRLDVARLAQLGQLLRGGIAAVSWASESLATPWPDRAVRELVRYEQRIVGSLARLGWRVNRVSS